MRILLDECLPRLLRRELPEHDVHTVTSMGWAGKKNGELLVLIVASGFQVLITVDRNLRYQQNLRAAGIAVLVLIAPNNRLHTLLPLMAEAREAIANCRSGDVIEIAQ